jgi:hypothetical protein
MRENKIEVKILVTQFGVDVVSVTECCYESFRVTESCMELPEQLFIPVF